MRSRLVTLAKASDVNALAARRHTRASKQTDRLLLSAAAGHRSGAARRRTAALATPFQRHDTRVQRRALPGSKKHHALGMARNPCYYESLRAT